MFMDPIYVFPIVSILAVSAGVEQTSIEVHPKEVIATVSRYMTGACIEDVNHEIYGGIYSQMIFGESFQEPAPAPALKDFKAYGGHWSVKGGELWAEAGEGFKLVSAHPAVTRGEINVEVYFPDDRSGNVGLIMKVDKPEVGPDNFIGYEIALEPQRGMLIVGRHRNNWEPIQDVPRKIPLREWIPITVKLDELAFEVLVNGQSMLKYADNECPLKSGAVGLRTWLRDARFRNLSITSEGQTQPLPFEYAEQEPEAVSGMWRPIRLGGARGSFALESQNCFTGGQSQRITFEEGQGAIGIANRSLNGWGMRFVANNEYEGYVWARCDKPVTLTAALESGNGDKRYAETTITVPAGDWQRIDFKLTPNADEPDGRFVLTLTEPGSVLLGHVYFEPGDWGRFKGLPIRKDVAEAMVAQGLMVLRYGGSMINAPEYRWKKMIGPRDHRPPYKATWYPYSTNGWGILDFLNLCEAAGFLGIPAFNIDETPQDMADFVEYTNGGKETPWGQKRAEDNHPEPYRLKYLEFGNEEKVDEHYWQRFEPAARAMWAKDPELFIVVGDFAYGEPITDPYNFKGSPSITSLATHKKILDLAKENNREVWFDVHVGTHNPRDPEGLGGIPTFIDALKRLSPGAKFKIAVFELNAVNHAVRRAISNAYAINQLERIGDDVRIICSANALQPYQQNDNGWDQGLVFLTPNQVWGQPPYYVTQMLSQHYLTQVIKADVKSPNHALDVTAKRSEDGKALQLQVVNLEKEPVEARINLGDFLPASPAAQVVQLSGQLDDINTPENPNHIAPQASEWNHNLTVGATVYSFPAHSFSIITFH